jgi:hypothetical protein
VGSLTRKGHSVGEENETTLHLSVRLTLTAHTVPVEPSALLPECRYEDGLYAECCVDVLVPPVVLRPRRPPLGPSPPAPELEPPPLEDRKLPPAE